MASATPGETRPLDENGGSRVGNSLCCWVLLVRLVLSSSHNASWVRVRAAAQSNRHSGPR